MSECDCPHHRHVRASVLTPAERRAAVGLSRSELGSVEIHAHHYTDSMRRRDQAARHSQTKKAASKPQKATNMPKYRSETPDVDARLTALEKRMTALEKSMKVAPPDPPDEGEETGARAPRVSYKSSRASELDREMGIGSNCQPAVRMEGTRQIVSVVTPEQARSQRGGK